MKKTIIILVVVVAAAVGIFELTKSDKKSTDASNTQTSTTGVTTRKASGNDNSFSGNLKSLSSGGKARKCSVSGATAGLQGSATIYTNGSGDLRYEISGVTDSSAPASNVTILMKGQKAYYWSDAGGTTYGFEIDLSSAQAASAASSFSALNQDYALDCGSWSSDSSKFDVPSDVTFSTIPSATQ